MTIYSFDGVLRQPRTSHSVDLPFTRKRVPLPRPVPMIAGAYLLAIELFLLVCDNVVSFTAVFGSGLSAVSGGRVDIAAWLIVYVLIPLALVYLVMNADIDGRAPYRWIATIARFVVSPRRTWCGQRVAAADERVRYRGRLRFWWDLDAPRLHHGFVRGGSVSTSVPVRFSLSMRHRHRVMHADDDLETVERYEVDDRLEVRP